MTAPAVPLPEQERTRRAVVPEQLRRGNLGPAAKAELERRWHQARFHAMRLPVYALFTALYGLRGGARLAGQWRRWVAVAEMTQLMSLAVAQGRVGHNDALRAHQIGAKTRSARWQITLATAVPALAVGAAAVAWLPWPVLALASMGALALLARRGKPAGKPLISPAIIAPQLEKLTPEIITRGLASIGISAINQALRDGPLDFVTDVHRDGPGQAVEFNLPYGVTYRMVMERREQLASGLRRPLSAVWPEGVPAEHEGRCRLWVGYQDMAKVTPAVSPLLRADKTDIFGQVPFGTDPRQRPVATGIFENNFLIGSAPGQGKTVTLLGLGCAAALDPVCDLWVHEHSGKGDLEPLAQVSHRYVSGLDDESVGYAAESLRLLRAEFERRSKTLKAIPKEQRPEGKLTRELAQRHAGLRPVVAIFDECHNLFGHPDYGGQAKDDAVYITRLGRAYGIVCVFATQRPDREAMPTGLTGLVTIRFCLYVPGHTENDMILGTSAHRNGYSATLFRPKTDRGMGWLRGEADPMVVRTYKLTLDKDAPKICARARAAREQAGVLSGYALGEAPGEGERSFAVDVLAVFGGDERLWLETVAARLREHPSGAYREITRDAVGSQLRRLMIPVKDVREAGRPNRKGCLRADVETAMLRAMDPGDA